MSGTGITIEGRDGRFGGYLARPAGVHGPLPGIVVIQEIFGVNAPMRAIADAYAARGYVALVPDLFWRLEPGVQLSDHDAADTKRAFDLMGAFDRNKGVEDIQSAIDALRAMPDVGKVGAAGYCLGGMLAFLTAARTDADAVAGYYGINLPALMDEAAKIQCPLLLHVAEKDIYVSPEARQKIIDGTSGNPNITVHVYPGVDHAFARPGGKNYDRASADLANGRTDTFLRRNLHA